jgi:hypothetical protein
MKLEVFAASFKGEKADPGSRDPVNPNGSYWILMDPDGS